MIEINLLPKGLRKKSQIVNLPKGTIINTAVITLFCLVIIHIMVSFLTCSKKNQAAELDLEWKVLQPSKMNAETNLQQIQTLKNKELLINKICGSDVIWARKLNLISDLIPPEIWLTKISLEHRSARVKPKGPQNISAMAAPLNKNQAIFIVSGIVESGRAKEMLSPVGRFITSLKKEPLFFNDFEEVELGPVDSKNIDERDVMVFELICVLKEKQEKPLEPAAN